jgi:Transposase DDE domain/Domain of unknown function (DUF4372)
MSKSTFFTGQPVLSQLLKLIPGHLVSRLSKEFDSDRYYKKFKTYDHLVSMLFCGFYQCTSLRELVTGLQANSSRLNHLGLMYTPRRSTLADANKNRSAEFFESLFHELYKLHYGILPDSRKGGSLYDRMFIIDSTTISLFSDVMKAAGYYRNGKRKGGVKAHMVMSVKDGVPAFVYLSESAKNDRVFMPMLKLPAGSVVAMDKGYVNYAVMNQWTQDKVTWVTRLNERAVYEVTENRVVTPHHEKNGVISDDNIILGHQQTQDKRPIQEARLVSYHDQSKNRTFTFLTNNLEFSPLTISNIYQRRWDIELLFKRVKQNFQFHNFLGDNENAIKIQVWCSLIADLLIAIMKRKVDQMRKSKWSFSNIASLIRLHLSTYIDLFKFLLNPDKAIIKYSQEAASKQMHLFQT